MNSMASLLQKPTTTAALRPLLRASVNAMRGHLFGGMDDGEGRECRTPFERFKIWRATRRLERLIRANPDYLKRRRAALKGWTTRRGRAC